MSLVDAFEAGTVEDALARRRARSLREASALAHHQGPRAAEVPRDHHVDVHGPDPSSSSPAHRARDDEG